tara:strand:- start:911 stop:1273 length:363 start_codon:yes stop_codon:yes gene_type:complete
MKDMILISLITGTIITLIVHQYMKSKENKLKGLNIWMFSTIGTAVASTIALIVTCLDSPRWDTSLWMMLGAYVLTLIHCYISIAIDDNFKYLEREIGTLKKQNRDTTTKAPSTYKRITNK